jgi:hypothetical protein
MMLVNVVSDDLTFSHFSAAAAGSLDKLIVCTDQVAMTTGIDNEDKSSSSCDPAKSIEKKRVAKNYLFIAFGLYFFFLEFLLRLPLFDSGEGLAGEGAEVNWSRVLLR